MSETAALRPAVIGDLDELLGEWVFHDRNHLRQLLAVTQARVWRQMGNARRFSLEESSPAKVPDPIGRSFDRT